MDDPPQQIRKKVLREAQPGQFTDIQSYKRAHDE